ncbi:hypothetical protein [Nocardia gipuzkoensis]
MPRGRARRYWRALGYYSTAEEGAVDFSASDADLVRLLTGYVDVGMVNEAEALHLSGVLARAIGRLARLQVEIVAGQRQRAPETVDTASALARRLPEVQWLLASRLTALARPDTALIAPAAELDGHPEFRLTPWGSADIRGIGTLTPVLLSRAD